MFEIKICDVCQILFEMYLNVKNLMVGKRDFKSLFFLFFHFLEPFQLFYVASEAAV